MSEQVVKNSISKEDLQKCTEFFQNDLFSIYRKVQWFGMLITLLGFLLIVRKEFFIWPIAHLGFCLLIAFSLGVVHIKMRFCFLLKRIDKYLLIAQLQHRWLSGTKSFKRAMSLEPSIPLNYFFKRTYVYWATGEWMVSLGFFILYSSIKRVDQASPR